MGCAHNKNQNGFTLVEIAIVMIIIGLLIGGTFGGMKLIENMQVNKTVQDLKAIESAALTFKDTYGRLAGDITNPSVRLSNCTVAPCATGGNGNRTYDTAVWSEVMTATMEKFTLWSHLQAADLLTLGTKNTTDLNFSEGQPESPLSGGYRITRYTGIFAIAGTMPLREAVAFITSESSATLLSGNGIECAKAQAIDLKIDDGVANDGYFRGYLCAALTPTSPYIIANEGVPFYDLKGF